MSDEFELTTGADERFSDLEGSDVEATEAELLETGRSEMSAPPKVTLEFLASAISTLTQKINHIESEALPKSRKRVVPQQSESENGEKKRRDYPVSTADRADNDEGEAIELALVTPVSEPAPQPEDDDGLYGEIEAAFDDVDEKGPPVPEKLASLLNARFGTKLPNKKLKEKLDKYEIPANCDNLNAPKTNEVIFRCMKSSVRQADVRLRNTQVTLVKAAVAVTRATEKLLKLRDAAAPQEVGQYPPDVKAITSESVGNLADALSLIGHATRDLSQKRRELHRPHLPRNTAGICAPHVPMTAQYLYPSGTDFHKSLLEARDTQRIGQSLRGGFSSFSQQGRGGYTHYTGSGNEPSFLGRGKGCWRGQMGEVFPQERLCPAERALSSTSFPFPDDNQVSTFTHCLSALYSYLRAKFEHFQAGQIRSCIQHWHRITSDPQILETVTGAKIRFLEQPDTDCYLPQRYFSEAENKSIDDEVHELLRKGVIRVSKFEEDQFVSPIFVVEKKEPGKYRMILNLKILNESVEYQKFKMETVQTALQLVTRDCYFASIDLRDAYYSVPVHPEYQKYLKFSWRGQLYCFQALPMGLGPVPRLFTKLTKPILAHLHNSGHSITSFIDDSLLLGRTQEETVQNVFYTVKIFDELGFVIHNEKSQFLPVQEITYLGFKINSTQMTVTLTEERKQKLLNACSDLLKQRRARIRIVASCIGLMVSSFLAIPHGPLHYRALERCKIIALKYSHSNWETYMNISDAALEELKWWLDEGACQSAPIHREKPAVVLHTDSSLQGWGAVIRETGLQANGLWSQIERESHINELELEAVFRGMKALIHDRRHEHVRIMSDNTTCVSCINKMGSNQSEVLNGTAFKIWQWCIHRGLWLSAAHIAGVDNKEADSLSRVLHTDMEWKLNSDLLAEALEILAVKPSIDLFASQVNAQFPVFVSFIPDSKAVAIDAFSLDWGDYEFYCFPPFSLLPRVLSKIRQDRACGTVVAPDWRNQPFWPMLMSMLTAAPVRLSARECLLQLPNAPAQKHPLRKILALLVCKVSGIDIHQQDYQRMLPEFSCTPGGQQQQGCMMFTSRSGNNMLLNRKWISFRLL